MPLLLRQKRSEPVKPYETKAVSYKKIDMRDELEIQTDIVKTLKGIHDPEIPVNIYDLGLIYEVDVDDNRKVTITMTLTAPNCPLADQVVEEVQEKISKIDGVTDVEVRLTFDPPWDKSRMSDEAMLELGFL
jgi:FeS assembly SUF system protein